MRLWCGQSIHRARAHSIKTQSTQIIMKTRLTSVLFRRCASRLASGLRLFREGGVLRGKHSITLKTLLCFFSTFALITVIATLDSHRLDVDVLFSSFGVAGLFAVALTEGRGPARPALSLRFNRPAPSAQLARPVPSVRLARPIPSVRLARFPGFESPQPQSSKVAA